MHTDAAQKQMQLFACQSSCLPTYAKQGGGGLPPLATPAPAAALVSLPSDSATAQLSPPHLIGVDEHDMQVMPFCLYYRTAVHTASRARLPASWQFVHRWLSFDRVPHVVRMAVCFARCLCHKRSPQADSRLMALSWTAAAPASNIPTATATGGTKCHCCTS